MTRNSAVGAGEAAPHSSSRWAAVRARVPLGPLLYLAFFALYLASIDLHAVNILWHNFIFDADVDRVTADATTRQGAVAFGRHPLFALTLALPATALSWLGLDLMASLRLVVASVGALGVVGAWVVFGRITGERGAAASFAVLYGTCATTWILSSIPETFAFSAAAIVGCFVMNGSSFARPRERPARFVAFSFVSALAVGVTVSNAAYVGLACAANAREGQSSWRKRMEVLAMSVAGAGTAFVALSLLQKVVFAARIPGDTGVVSPLGAAKGDIYLDFGRAWSLRDALALIRAFAADNLVAPTPYVEVVATPSGPAQMIQYGGWTAPLYLAAVSAVLGLVAACVVRADLRAVARSRTAQLAASYVAYNLCLHYLYRANGQPFIFSVHTVFPILVVLAEVYARGTWAPRRWLLAGALAAVALDNAAFVLFVREALAMPCERRLYWICTSWPTDGAGARYSRGLRAYLDSPDYPSDEGSEAIDRGDGPGAERYFRAALAMAPDGLQAERGLGLALLLSGRQAEAAGHLRRVIERDPKDTGLRDLLERMGAAR